MCGGRYSKWKMPRQMTPVNGEPIVARTIRLLRDAGASDICISTTYKRFKKYGVPILTHDNKFAVTDDVAGCWAEAFYPTPEPACYVFGDVVFSPQAIETIVNTGTDDVMFFASAPPFSKWYIKEHAEPFAFKVANQRRFRAAIELVKSSINVGIYDRPPIAWELWQTLNGESVRDINFDNYIAINDYTCDIDKPDDVAAIERAVHNADNDTRLYRARVVC